MIDVNEIAKKAFSYANKRAFSEDLESPCDVIGMCRHASSELFEVIDAYNKWSEYYFDESHKAVFTKENIGVVKCKVAFADEISDVIMCMLIIAKAQGVDIEKALEKCLEKNRQRADAGVKE